MTILRLAAARVEQTQLVTAVVVRSSCCCCSCSYSRFGRTASEAATVRRDLQLVPPEGSENTNTNDDTNKNSTDNTSNTSNTSYIGNEGKKPILIYEE